MFRNGLDSKRSASALDAPKYFFIGHAALMVRIVKNLLFVLRLILCVVRYGGSCNNYYIKNNFNRYLKKELKKYA